MFVNVQSSRARHPSIAHYEYLTEGTVVMTNNGRNSPKKFHAATCVLALAAALVPACAAIADGFTSTNPMSGPRYGASDILLSSGPMSGRVLLAGGFDGSANLASAVIWNPADGTFSASTNNLSLARGFMTVTQLGGGKILFADGGNGSDEDGAYPNTDLYDPSTGFFAVGPSTHDPRHNSTATLLGNGKVLIAGGITNDVNFTRLATAELYDPVANTFTYTGSMHEVRDFHVAVLLPNGNVLIAGGGNGSGIALNSAEIYNVGTGTFTLLANTMVERRDDATATLLNNGKVLIVGGVNQDVTSGTAELFDYTNNTFTKVPTAITPRHFHTATLLNDGRVLIVGGLGASTDTAQTLTDAQLYDPTTNSFAATGALHVARFYHMATKLADGRVLVAGGYNGGGATATAEVYGPLTDQIFKNGFD